MPILEHGFSSKKTENKHEQTYTDEKYTMLFVAVANICLIQLYIVKIFVERCKRCGGSVLMHAWSNLCIVAEGVNWVHFIVVFPLASISENGSRPGYINDFSR